MQISKTPGTINRLRKGDWRYQQTFHTPLPQLPAFTNAIITAHAPLRGASVTIEQVVFHTTRLDVLLSSHHLPLEQGRDWTIMATGEDEIAALLEAALGDVIDFFFLPSPKRFLIYADHDEYLTIFAATKGHLSRIVTSLSAGGFSRVTAYERSL